MNWLWSRLTGRARITLDDALHARLEKFLDLLLTANLKMNLTRITDRAAAETLHIGDAMTLLPFLPDGVHRLADVGSGGGVPGMVLAILRPDISIVLIESTRKKADFLRETAAELGLMNVTIENCRAEEAARSNLRESFDVVVARAVGTMIFLAEWMLPLTKRGGYALAMKGPKATEELVEAARAISALGGGKPEIIPADLPGAENHVIVKIPKIGRTDLRFPRAPSASKQKPPGE